MNPWTVESRAKQSASLTGRTIPADVRKKMSLNNARTWLGKKFNASVRKKMSDAAKGRIPWNRGVKGSVIVSEQEREARRVRMTGLRTGAANPMWKGGVTPIRTKLWRSDQYRAWRLSIFTADGYRCQMCGTGGRLEADHYPVPFAAHIARIRLSTTGDLYQAALSDNQLWAASGRTLCVACHNTTKRGCATVLKAKSEEQQLARYQA